MAERQVAAELGDGRVIVDQFLPNRQRRPVLGLCFQRLACRREQNGRSVDRGRQVPPRVGRSARRSGQYLLVRTRQAIVGQGFVVTARGVE